MREYLNEHSNLLNELNNSTQSFIKNSEIAKSAIIDVLNSDGKLLIAGNGGSASQASHFTAELVGRFERERKALPAIALTADNAVLTALSNDYSFETVFTRQLEALGRPGDMFIALSTSGNSKNLLRAAAYASSNNITCLYILGKDGGALKQYPGIKIIVPHQNTACIQVIHLILIHYFCQQIENSLLV